MIMIHFQDGMGNLQLNEDGIHLAGVSEFQLPLYVNEIQSRRVSLDELGITKTDWSISEKLFRRKMSAELQSSIDLPVLRKFLSIH